MNLYVHIIDGPDTGWWKSIYLVICAAAALFIVYKKWRELKQMNKKQNDWISLSVGGLTAIVMRSGGYMEESSLLLLRQLCSELQFGNTDAVVNMAQHVYGQPRVNRSFYTNYVKVYHTYPHRLSVMNTMYQVAKTSGSINEDTWQLLMEIGNELLITPSDQTQLADRYNQYRRIYQSQQQYGQPSFSGNETDYRTLELQPGADTEEVKKAYRRLAMVYHPDKAPADKKEEYKQKFIAINEAYGHLCGE